MAEPDGRGLGRAVSAGATLYEVATCTPTPGDVRTDADFSIRITHGAAALAEADTVLVPASHDPNETDTNGRLSDPLADALDHIRPNTRIASICTGAFVLAAAGLLAGRRATTHWQSAGAFRRLYPDVELDPDVLYTDNGDILTSATYRSGAATA